MKYEKYKFEQVNTLTFTFTSEGRKGKIKKIIRYARTDKLIFNLSFGDKISSSSDFNDKVVSDNGDTVKVIATVVATFLLFFEQYPNCAVVFNGSTNSRNRMYRYVIDKHYDDFTSIYVIKGFRKDRFVKYKKGEDYSAFAIYIKK